MENLYLERKTIDDARRTFSRIQSSFVTNPVLMGIITIGGFVLTVFGLYLTFASTKEAKPIYKILSDIVVTERKLDSKIKVFYDTTEVENVRAVTIAIWNAGNQYINKTDFFPDKPLSISCSEKVDLLDVKILKTSRLDLQFKEIHNVFNPFIKIFYPELPQNLVELEIKGDEVLEAKDGLTVQILYTSQEKDCKWAVKARIKGLVVPNAFEEGAPSDGVRQYGQMAIYIALLLFMTRVGTRYVSKLVYALQPRAKLLPSIVRVFIELAITAILLLITTVGFDLVYPFDTIPLALLP